MDQKEHLGPGSVCVGGSLLGLNLDLSVSVCLGRTDLSTGGAKVSLSLKVLPLRLFLWAGSGTGTVVSTGCRRSPWVVGRTSGADCSGGSTRETGSAGSTRF